MLRAEEHNVSRDELAHFGRETLAYIKPFTVKGRKFYIICSAEGSPIGIVTDRDLAFAAIRQNDMDPVSVH
ncbi:MAG: DUF1150 family protein [Bdellovibrionales bacterium]|jgi:hypothetical protein